MSLNNHIETNDEPDGQVAFKCVVANGVCQDYAIYVGPSDWTDAEVFSQGTKLPTDAAKSLAYHLPFLAPQWYNMQPRI